MLSTFSEAIVFGNIALWIGLLSTLDHLTKLRGDPYLVCSGFRIFPKCCAGIEDSVAFTSLWFWPFFISSFWSLPVFPVNCSAWYPWDTFHGLDTRTVFWISYAEHTFICIFPYQYSVCFTCKTELAAWLTDWLSPLECRLKVCCVTLTLTLKCMWLCFSYSVGENIKLLIDRPDGVYCFRLHKDRVYYVRFVPCNSIVIFSKSTL